MTVGSAASAAAPTKAMLAAQALQRRLAAAAEAAPHHEGLPHRPGFGEALDSLLTWDCIRWSRLIETAQCAALYAILGVLFGVAVDRAVRVLYPQAEGPIGSWRELGLTLAVVVLQVVLSAVLVIIIRKVASLVPFFFNLCPSRYVEGYHVQEMDGELAVGLAYVGSQTTLIRQLEKINEFLTKKKREGA